jgi:hypothetical protein
VAHARSSCPDHLGEYFLTDLCNDRLRPTFLTEICQQQQKPRKPRAIRTGLALVEAVPKLKAASRRASRGSPHRGRWSFRRIRAGWPAGFSSIAILGPSRFTESVPAWELMGTSETESRFEALRTATTPLVRRDEDIVLDAAQETGKIR